MRKICECIAHLCLIAVDINFDDIPNNLRKQYEVGKILTFLEKKNRLNFMWQHAIQIVDSKVFFVDFKHVKNMTKPLLIKHDGFLDLELKFDFDPEFVSDFVGKVNWDEYR